MLKGCIQALVRRLGYRIVPRERDASTVLDLVFTSQIDTIIDVGANRGDTCRTWLQRFPAAHVHAFEPMPEAVKALRRNTAPWANRINIWQLGASDKTGEVPFELHTQHSSSSSLQRRTEFSADILPFTADVQTIVVPTRTLDEALLSDETSRLGRVLLKLDVQGHELAVLRGAEKLLRQTHFVLTEVNLLPLYENQPTFVELAMELERRGFKFSGVSEQFHLNDGRAVYLDALFERQHA